MTKPVDEKAVFLAALAVAAADRDAFLRGACPDAKARERIEALLRSHEPISPEEAPSALAHFRIVRKLGEGGMGIVYLAHDEILERPVALKILSGARAADPTALARFYHEAKVVAGLAAPGIVQIYQFGEDHGQHYLCMEHVDGPTLAEWRAHERDAAVTRNGGELNRRAAKEHIRRVASIIEQVARALEIAHSNDPPVIHRDVKPSNILIDSGNRARLTDFGIAKIVAVDTLTIDGSIAGTPQYMSPEQVAQGQVKIDRRSDIFSLGAVMYESLTGIKPFEGETIHQVLEAVRCSHPRSPTMVDPTVPKDLSIVCLKALEKEPTHRYPTAGHMAADLRAWLEGAPILARPATPMRRVKRVVYTRRYMIGALATMAAGIAIGAAFFVGPDHERQFVDASTFGRSATIWMREIDMRSGRVHDPVLLGRADRVHEVPFGLIRFIIINAEGHQAEFTRLVPRAARVEIKGHVVPRQKATKDMVFVVRRLPVEADTAYSRRVTGLVSYWIDATEVTCAEYAKFVDDTEAEPPPIWDGPVHPDGWAELPVTGVTWEEAQRFAEWSGKRLPTALEWEFMARGADARRFPWGNEPSDVPSIRARANTYNASREHRLPADEAQGVDGRLIDGWSELTLVPAAHRAELQAYIASRVKSVGDYAQDYIEIAGKRVTHVLGNVTEWTETPYVLPKSPASQAEASGFWTIVGEPWTRGDQNELVDLSASMMSPSQRRVAFGFRCARSEDLDTQ
ncbi:MAG: protein kinase [Planctomycetota bacterium]